MPEIEEIQAEETAIEEPLKRQRGRPRKDNSPTKTTVSDVPNPPFTKYYSEHRNPPQRTTSAWAWWNKLPVPAKEIIEAHVYRDWPVLLDPPEGEYKYIDVIIGTDPIQNDQDFIDKYGAGKYHVYLNANPAATGSRRTLFTAHIDGSHDTTKFPPCDKRIQNIDNISLTDPANAAFVAALRASGKLKDDAKDAKEKEEMSATAEVLGKVLDQSTAVMNRMLDEKDKQLADAPTIPTDPPPSPQEVISEQLSIFKSLKELVPTSDPLEMVKQVIGMAQVLTQGKEGGNADLKPLMDEIAKLREESRATEREFFRTQLADVKEQLRAVKDTPPSSNVLLPDGSNLDSIVKKAVEKAVENGLGGESDNSWWVDPLKQVAPFAIPAIMTGLAQMFMPKPAAAPASNFPMPPQNFQAGGVTQPQAQLPPPAQPQPQPVQQPQQQGASYTTGNPQLDMLLMMIQVPLADHLRDDATGAEFAEYFIENYSFDIHTQLASSGTDAVVGVLYSYPPLAPILKPLARERVVKFVDDFVKFKPPVVETAGGAA